ncbi:hypothetical protein [Marininema halotolerans]|uniref:DUF7916 domain-containing protein n=1 Tax=Marininema halotolerans TaxID=1155944 RepID=A0A1I6TD66_9BACL|nr:hypothetical protein [Marininema halotolerans]SFS87125.1 hypothetical protein SAMN05444972_109177 [Marininema halotolerans]
MVKRLIDATPAELIKMTGRELLCAMKQSEGRTVVTEMVAPALPLVDGCSNVEIAAAFGADLILLNKYDVSSPKIGGFPSQRREELSQASDPLLIEHLEILGLGRTIQDVERYVGRPIGINLEPVTSEVSTKLVPTGRRATLLNGEKALEQGARFIVLTGNPLTGVTPMAITEQLKVLRRALGPDLILMAGKMHHAGVVASKGGWLSETEIENWIHAGADVILLPLPGSVPGVSTTDVAEWVHMCQGRGALSMLTLGTSQESATPTVIERLAINGKMAGGDLYHIGDAGFSGMALPENIHAYSISLKGRRHTYRRMALSLHR